MQALEYKAVIQKNEEGDGYWAYCPDLPGCNAIGETFAEIRENIAEAIVGYLETLSNMKRDIPSPQQDSVFLETIAITV
jgi:predicted RNase H-like HicB family nuclease